jgi:hypothetical protein
MRVHARVKFPWRRVTLLHKSGNTTQLTPQMAIKASQTASIRFLSRIQGRAASKTKKRPKALCAGFGCIVFQRSALPCFLIQPE